MKIVRYESVTGEIGHGAMLDDRIMRIEGDLFGPHVVTREAVDAARLLAPVKPPAIFCIGLNYRKHAEETGAKIPSHPVLFMKNPAALQHPGGPVEIPMFLRSTAVDFEGELVVVIGRECKNIRPSEAEHFILGFTIGNDVSARDWQRDFGGGQFCRGKTFDTFAPIGPAIVTHDELPVREIAKPGLVITTRVNGQVMQESSTADMIFDVPTLVAFLSGSTTLLPGTIIYTGTPSGVGMARKPPVWLKKGDEVSITIDRVGTLTNPIVNEGQP